MECPACSNSLQQMTVGDVTVDVCKGGCGGIWFDNFELKKFDEPHESAGQTLLDIERDQTMVLDYEKRLNCPKCKDAVMMRMIMHIWIMIAFFIVSFNLLAFQQRGLT